MLTSSEVRSDSGGRHGSGRIRIAELRRQLARPSQLKDVHRQRLLDLAQRLTHVRALGDEYRRVSLSESALAALGENTPVA